MSLAHTNLYFRIYVYFVTFVFGAVMGSFLNCMAYRICHNMSIVKGRSKCDVCNHTLGVRDLIPILGYILNKGKCRYCGAKLSVRYLISEIVGGLSFVLVVYKYGLTIETIMYLILISLMLCASFADLEDYLIPDRLIVFGLINRLVFILIGNNIKNELISSLIGGLCISVPILILSIVMSKILKRDAMGGGDIKLFFMLGTYFSVSQNIFSVLLACIIGIVFSVITKKTKDEFPFGPSICLAYFLTMMIGTGIINWYLNLFM